jgi:hypothetical protein
MAIVSVTRSTYIWPFKHKTRKSDSERFVAYTEAIAKLWPLTSHAAYAASRIGSSLKDSTKQFGWLERLKRNAMSSAFSLVAWAAPGVSLSL